MSGCSAFDRVAEACRSLGLLDSGDCVVVAVSGGADSTFLLHSLRRLGVPLHVAHLHHGIRGVDADGDAQFVERLSASLDLACTVESVSIPMLRHRDGGSLEEVARRERYAFLARVASAIEARRVAVGHTADDQAETVLFRLLRGAGLRGLRGMPAIRRLSPGADVSLVRPILDVRRREIEAALSAEGLVWREDPSNADLEMTRNAIRQILLPRLTQARADVIDALLRLANRAAAAQRVIEAEALRLAARATSSDGDVRIDRALLERARSQVVAAALHRWIAGPMGKPFSLRRSSVERFAALLAEGTRSGSSAPLGRGVVAIREAGAIRLTRPVRRSSPTLRDVPLLIPGETRAATGLVQSIIEDGVERVGAATVRTSDRFAVALDLDRAGRILLLGTPKPMDRMRPLGAPGSKPLRRLLTDWKVPPRERSTLPILRGADGRVLWAIGHRIADDARVTSETRAILRLSFRPETVT